jgi:hypothetical protein
MCNKIISYMYILNYLILINLNWKGKKSKAFKKKKKPRHLGPAHKKKKLGAYVPLSMLFNRFYLYI